MQWVAILVPFTTQVPGKRNRHTYAVKGSTMVASARWRASTSNTDSKEVRFLHDAEEFLLIDLAIAVAICLIDHFLQFLIRHALTEFFCYALQVLEGDLTGLVVIEKAECFQDLVLWVTVQDFVRHHFQELFVSNRAASVIVNIRDHLLDLLLLWLEAQSAHRHLQLLRVDLSGAVGVEEVKGLLDLLLLLLCELLLLLATH